MRRIGFLMFLVGAIGSVGCGSDSETSSAENISNILINGGFEIWQRGDNERPDMWNQTDDSNCAFQRVATAGTTPGAAQGDAKLRLDCAGQSDNAFYRLQDIESYRGRSMTLSVDIKGNIGSSPRVQVDYGNQAADSIYTGSGAWQRLTVRFPIPATESDRVVIRIFPADSGVIEVDNAMLVFGDYDDAVFYPTLAQTDWTGALQYYQTGTVTASQLTSFNDGSYTPVTSDGATHLSGYNFAIPMENGAQVSITYAQFVVDDQWTGRYPWILSNEDAFYLDDSTDPVTEVAAPLVELSGATASWDYGDDNNPELACSLTNLVDESGLGVMCDVGGDWADNEADDVNGDPVYVYYYYSYIIDWVAEVPILEDEG